MDIVSRLKTEIAYRRSLRLIKWLFWGVGAEDPNLLGLVRAISIQQQADPQQITKLIANLYATGALTMAEMLSMGYEGIPLLYDIQMDKKISPGEALGLIAQGSIKTDYVIELLKRRYLERKI
jgi:hypothetical protein